MEDRSEKLAALRKSLAAHDAQIGNRVLGQFSPAESALGCALRRNALHEVYAHDASYGAAATGFAIGLAMRLRGARPVFWITTDFALLEYGNPMGSGFLECGVDPRQFVLLHLPKAEDVLRAAGDILACRHVGALVVEIQGNLKALDLNTSRRIALAASERDIPAILLRFGAAPMASAAETRWLVHAAASPPPQRGSDWGQAAFEVQLLRNRHGQLGEWRMEWDAENGFFRGRSDHESTPHPVGVASAPADRPLAAEETARRTAI